MSNPRSQVPERTVDDSLRKSNRAASHEIADSHLIMMMSSTKFRARDRKKLFVPRLPSVLSLLTLHIFLLWSLQNIPPSDSFGLVTMAPNIQPFEHLPVPIEDERIRCALLGCGMVSRFFWREPSE